MNLIGHKDKKKLLEISYKAAVVRNSAMPHMLFAGAAGCGKTTLAKELHRTKELPFISCSSKSITTRKDVISLLDSLDHSGYNERGDRTDKITPSILFIDEVHNINMVVQEELGIAMEEFQIPANTPDKFYWIPRFTLIGATTVDGQLSKPFRDRFKMRFLFETYNIEEMQKIAEFHAGEKNLTITPKALRDIVQRSKGTPRVLVRYIEGARDFGIAHESDVITHALVNDLFEHLKIDKHGFTDQEIKVLRVLMDAGRSVGLETLATAVNESKVTLKDTIEPYLVQMMFMTVSGSGRTLLEKGKEYLIENGYLGHKKKVPISHGYKRK